MPKLFVKDAPKESLVIRGARVLDPAEGIDTQVDVKVDNGVIAELGSNLPQNSHKVIDGTGLVLAPAFVDPHVHLRTPGREEADRDLRVSSRLLGQRAEDCGRVDDRLRVRHREDRAVAACRGRLRAAGDRLLVLAPWSAEVNVRVDEGRRQHEPGSVEHAVPVDGEARAQLGDRAAVDLHVDLRVDALGRIEHAGAADDEALLRCVLDEEPRHHATSTGSSALTAAGPVVSRS